MIVGRDALSGRLIGLSVENGKIAALRHIEEDLDGDIPWLAPGLVDLQVNGWAGMTSMAMISTKRRSSLLLWECAARASGLSCRR